MKKIILVGYVLCSAMASSQVGINTATPTNTLDVNGTTRIRDLTLLTSPTISALYADQNGVLGTANITPQSQVAFYTTASTMSYNAANYNTGATQIVQIQSSHAVLNTIGTTVSTIGQVTIGQTGNYMLSGSVAPSLTINNDGDGYAYMAVNLEVSTDGGSSWTSVTGGRPMFPRVGVGVTRIYSFTMAPVIKSLNAGNLIRVIFYRTKDGGGTLQGSSMSSIDLSFGYGSPTYTLSLNKL
ncbi:hypothetical protein JOE44_001360 [Chryseobacterium sp. PvR013]|uniref:hypothetical protein n=1 Tax=Chryseobacterium sp. PvR013 TaxID=2806595 RepID=UPI001AE46B32|nr:hypothetical protein [Chryseobacterium sp. PvR013]MBP1164476.1 hypothetical protein [Chryseobacterium sp. PvR013]